MRREMWDRLGEPVDLLVVGGGINGGHNGGLSSGHNSGSNGPTNINFETRPISLGVRT